MSSQVYAVKLYIQGFGAICSVDNQMKHDFRNPSAEPSFFSLEKTLFTPLVPFSDSIGRL